MPSTPHSFLHFYIFTYYILTVRFNVVAFLRLTFPVHLARYVLRLTLFMYVSLLVTISLFPYEAHIKFVS